MTIVQLTKDRVADIYQTHLCRISRRMNESLWISF